MDQQAPGQETDANGRLRYVAAFLPIAWAGVNTMFTQPACQLESFGVDGDDTVHATAVVSREGQRYRFKRQVWPASHPALLAAQLYTTSLEERLNTGALRSSNSDIIDL